MELADELDVEKGSRPNIKARLSVLLMQVEVKRS
jgi:hypothetical protein